jgi:two-component system, chemotaxis family, protein-glutamate methylesterase/glutaminase
VTNTLDYTKYKAIVIGTSWGGLDAISKILAGMPEDFVLPVVVVIHRLRNVESSLVDLIGKKTKLKVKEVDEKEPLSPGMVYLAPANYHVLIEKDLTFSLSVDEPVLFSRPSIDVLFESAAEAYGDQLVGVILTGANSDGSKGLKKISSMGGLTIVQLPDEAEVSTMPLSALRLVKPDHILSLNQIKDFFIKLHCYE